MRLVPCAKVSVVYSEKIVLKMGKPKFSHSSSCIYNNFVDTRMLLSGQANIEVIKKE